MLEQSRRVVEFLSPAKIEEDISSFSELKSFIKKSSPYTVLPIDFFDSMLKKIPDLEITKQGNWVQVGVWKGGGSLFFKALMSDLNVKHQLFLYDTFGGIPVADFTANEDVAFVREFNMADNKSTLSYKQDVENLFAKFNLNEDVKFIQSDVNHLAPANIPDKIALLFIDVDFYKPTLATLNLFYDKVMPGGVIIADDYFLKMFNCKNAVDDFFKSREIDLTPLLSKLSSYSAIIIKPHLISAN